MKTYTNILPPGAYLVTAVGIGDVRESVAGNRFRAVEFGLTGTDRRGLFVYAVDSPQARFVWDTIVPTFWDLPMILGRNFIGVVWVQDYMAQWRNKLTLIAEVLPNKEQS